MSRSDKRGNLDATNGSGLRRFRREQHPFRLLTSFAATFPKGTALGGDGKLSGIAKRRPLGGAGTAQAVTEGGYCRKF